MNILYRTNNHSIIKVVELATAEFDALFNESDYIILQVAELTNSPRRMIVEAILIDDETPNEPEKEIETLNL